MKGDALVVGGWRSQVNEWDHVHVDCTLKPRPRPPRRIINDCSVTIEHLDSHHYHCQEDSNGVLQPPPRRRHLFDLHRDAAVFRLHTQASLEFGAKKQMVPFPSTFRSKRRTSSTSTKMPSSLSTLPTPPVMPMQPISPCTDPSVCVLPLHRPLCEACVRFDCVLRVTLAEITFHPCPAFARPAGRHLALSRSLPPTRSRKQTVGSSDHV